MKADIGDIVISTKGRDKGTYYVVEKILPDNYLVLVNGDNKLFISPKHKTKKHIASTGKSLENIKYKLENNIKVFDTEIYSAIKKFKEETNNL